MGERLEKGKTGEGSFQEIFLNTLQGIPNIFTMQEHLLAYTDVKEVISNIDESKILLLRGSTISLHNDCFVSLMWRRKKGRQYDCFSNIFVIIKRKFVFQPFISVYIVYYHTILPRKQYCTFHCILYSGIHYCPDSNTVLFIVFFYSGIHSLWVVIA